MPQVIEVTDAEGRKATYVPLSRDGTVVDSSAVVQKLKDLRKEQLRLSGPARTWRFFAVSSYKGDKVWYDRCNLSACLVTAC